MSKALIVDDAMFMRKMVTDLARKAGVTEIVEASNVKEAVDAYIKENPNIVIMDITMPDIDGIEGVKLIREKDPKAVILMCSAMGQKAMVIDAIKAGAVDFIVKPIDTGKMISVIQKYI